MVTPKPLTDAEIEAMEKRAEGASLGPWEWERGVEDSFGPISGNYAGVDLFEHDEKFLRTAREDALRLISDLKACREALRFYSDASKYERTFEDDRGFTLNPEEWVYSEPDILDDGGDTARAALGVE